MHASILKARDPEQSQVDKRDQEETMGKEGRHVGSPYRTDHTPRGCAHPKAKAQVLEEPGADRLILVFQIGSKVRHVFS